MPILRSTITSSIMCSLLCACASQQVDIKSTKFLTRISDSGLKHFEVVLPSRNAQRQQKAISSPQEAKARQRQERRSRPKKTKRKLEHAAQEHVDNNGFCRTGFWVIDSNVYGPNMSLRGECHEPANDEDRRNFPDTIKEW